MPQDWQINDIALCIKQGCWEDRETGELVADGPTAGQLLTVSFVTTGWTAKSKGKLLLHFEEFPRDFYAAKRFIKIKPEDQTETDSRSELALWVSRSAELVEVNPAWLKRHEQT